MIVQLSITWTVSKTWEGIVKEINLCESQLISEAGSQSHFLVPTMFEDLVADGMNGIIVTF